MNVLADLDGFLQKHRYCGEIEAEVEGDRLWMTRTRSENSFGSYDARLRLDSAEEVPPGGLVR